MNTFLEKEKHINLRLILIYFTSILGKQELNFEPLQSPFEYW